MSECRECKSVMAEDARFCPKCGARSSDRWTDQQIIEEVFKRQVKRGVIV